MYMDEGMAHHDNVSIRGFGSGGFPIFGSGGQHSVLLLVVVLLILFAVFARGRGGLFGGGDCDGFGLSNFLGGALATNNASEKVIQKIDSVERRLDERFCVVDKEISNLKCEVGAEIAEIKCMNKEDKLSAEIAMLKSKIAEMACEKQASVDASIIKKLNAIECNLGINDNCCPTAPAPAPANAAIASLTEAVQQLQAQMITLATKVKV